MIYICRNSNLCYNTTQHPQVLLPIINASRSIESIPDPLAHLLIIDVNTRYGENNLHPEGIHRLLR